MVQVPQVKYVLHRKPVVYETVTSEVSYMNVPVQYQYEAKDYPQAMQSDCAQPQQAQAPCQQRAPQQNMCHVAQNQFHATAGACCGAV